MNTASDLISKQSVDQVLNSSGCLETLLKSLVEKALDEHFSAKKTDTDFKSALEQVNDEMYPQSIKTRFLDWMVAEKSAVLGQFEDTLSLLKIKSLLSGKELIELDWDLMISPVTVGLFDVDSFCIDIKIKSDIVSSLVFSLSFELRRDKPHLFYIQLYTEHKVLMDQFKVKADFESEPKLDVQVSSLIDYFEF